MKTVIDDEYLALGAVREARSLSFVGYDHCRGEQSTLDPTTGASQ